MAIRVQTDAFDPGAELTEFTARQVNAGAIVSFTGLVRDVEGGLKTMHIEHYPGMTERAIRTIATQALDRWSLSDALVIHRHGTLRPRDVIMMVATAAKHRADAFAAADFLMDYLKSRAPFWKKENTGSGSGWVEATSADQAALERW